MMDQGKGKQRRWAPAVNNEAAAFRRAAHALVDDLPDGATWRTLCERAEVEADIEDAALGYFRQLEVE